MKLSAGLLIGFLFLAGPPLRICRGSSQAEETCREEIAAHSSRASAAAQEHDFAKAEEEWRKVWRLIRYSLGQTYLQLPTKTFQHIATLSPESYRVHQILAGSLA